MNSRDSPVASTKWNCILFPHQSLAVRSWSVIHDVIEELGSLFLIFHHVCAPFLRLLCCCLFTSHTTLSLKSTLPVETEYRLYKRKVSLPVGFFVPACISYHDHRLPPSRVPCWIFLHIPLKVVQRVNFKIVFHQNNGSTLQFIFIKAFVEIESVFKMCR